MSKSKSHRQHVAHVVRFSPKEIKGAGTMACPLYYCYVSGERAQVLGARRENGRLLALARGENAPRLRSRQLAHRRSVGATCASRLVSASCRSNSRRLSARPSLQESILLQSGTSGAGHPMGEHSRTRCSSKRAQDTLSAGACLQLRGTARRPWLQGVPS
jgi:hypothetical protein